jgi:hypothetical protein
LAISCFCCILTIFWNPNCARSLHMQQNLDNIYKCLSFFQIN